MGSTLPSMIYIILALMTILVSSYLCVLDTTLSNCKGAVATFVVPTFTIITALVGKSYRLYLIFNVCIVIFSKPFA